MNKRKGGKERLTWRGGCKLAEWNLKMFVSDDLYFFSEKSNENTCWADGWGKGHKCLRNVWVSLPPRGRKHGQPVPLVPRVITRQRKGAVCVCEMHVALHWVGIPENLKVESWWKELDESRMVHPCHNQVFPEVKWVWTIEKYKPYQVAKASPSSGDPKGGWGSLIPLMVTGSLEGSWMRATDDEVGVLEQQFFQGCETQLPELPRIRVLLPNYVLHCGNLCSAQSTPCNILAQASS